MQARARAWGVVALLWFVVCSNFLARLMITTMHGSLLSSIPMSESQFGLLTTLLLLVYGLVSPFAGFLSDRFGRSRVIISSLLAWSATTWLSSYASTFPELLLSRAVMGLTEACYLPAGLALVNDYHQDSTRSLASGIHQSGIFIGMALAGLGGILAEWRNWHFAFQAVGLAGIAYAVLLLVLLRDAPRAPVPAEARPESPPRFAEALLSLFRQRSFVLAVLNWGLLGTVSWIVFGWMPLFLQERFHLGQGAAGLSATFYSNLAAMPGLVAGGIWADRWSRRSRRARMHVPAIGLLFAAPSILLTATTGILWAAVLGIVCYRLFSSFIDSNMMPILCAIVDRRFRATAYGLLNMAGVLGAGTGVYLAGVMRDHRINLEVAYIAVSLVTLLAAPMFYLMRPASEGA